MPSSAHTATSPTAPTDSWPISPSRPRQRAPPRVAMSRASRACMASGPPRRRPSSSALRLSIQSDAESVDDEPSQPMPTGTPAARSSATGASPAPIIWFELGQWATPVPQAAEPLDLLGVRVDAVGDPRAVGAPADVLEVLDRAAAVDVEAVGVLVDVLGQVGVQAHVEPLGQLGGGLHQPGRHRERRARGQRHLDHGVGPALVVHGRPAARTRPGSCRRPARPSRAGRPPSFCDRLIEPAGGVEAHAQLAGRGDLGGDEVAAAGGVHVEVVHRRGAAAEGQLGQADPRRQVGGLLVEPGPDRVQRGQPAEQVGRRGRAVGPGEVLVDVVVGVDQARA